MDEDANRESGVCRQIGKEQKIEWVERTHLPFGKEWKAGEHAVRPERQVSRAERTLQLDRERIVKSHNVGCEPNTLTQGHWIEITKIPGDEKNYRQRIVTAEKFQPLSQVHTAPLSTTAFPRSFSASRKDLDPI